MSTKDFVHIKLTAWLYLARIQYLPVLNYFVDLFWNNYFFIFYCKLMIIPNTKEKKVNKKAFDDLTKKCWMMIKLKSDKVSVKCVCNTINNVSLFELSNHYCLFHNTYLFDFVLFHLKFNIIENINCSLK